jgi:hypothetical protein
MDIKGVCVCFKLGSKKTTETKHTFICSEIIDNCIHFPHIEYPTETIIAGIFSWLDHKPWIQ